MKAVYNPNESGPIKQVFNEACLIIDENLAELNAGIGTLDETTIQEQISQLINDMALLKTIYGLNVTPSFSNSWENNAVTGSTFNNFASVERMAADRFAIIAGGRNSDYCARIEVRPGDNPLAPASPGTERAEVYGLRGSDNATIKENESSGIVLYEFSVKFDPTWRKVDQNSYMIFWQMKAPAGVSANPLINFSATDKIRVALKGGNELTETRKYYNLTDGNLNIGSWIDFKVTINFKKDATGFLIIERRNEGKQNFTQVLNLQNVATLLYNPEVNDGEVGDHYPKFGLYRNAQTFTSILYNDNYKRSVISKP